MYARGLKIHININFGLKGWCDDCRRCGCGMYDEDAMKIPSLNVFYVHID